MGSLRSVTAVGGVLAAVGLPAAPGLAAAVGTSPFAAAPSIDLARISPAGDRLAFVQGQGDHRVILVQSVADRVLLMRLPLGKVSVTSLVWGDEDHVVVGFTSVARLEGLVRSEPLTGADAGVPIGANPLETHPTQLGSPPGEWRQALSLNVLTKKASPLLNRRVAGVGPMLNVVTDDPAPRALASSAFVYLSGVRYLGSEPAYALFRVSPDGAATELIDPGGPNPAEWLVSKDGRGFLRAEYQAASRRWRLVTGGAGVVTTERMSLEAAYGQPHLLGLDPVSGAALVQTAAPSGRVRTLAIPFAPSEAVVARALPALERAVVDEETGALQQGIAVSGEALDLTAAEARARQVLLALLPGADVRLEAASSARSRFVYLVVGGAHGCSYWLVDAAGGPTFIGDRYEGLTRDDYARAQRLAPRGSDRDEDPWALFTPPLKETAKPPLIVLFRSRAWLTDPPGADWLVQALAGAGYAVLEAAEHDHPSPGDLGRSAGEGAWRGADADEALARVRELTAAGEVDPQRICALGHGFGALAAIDLVARSGGQVRCAATIAGAADPRSMLDLTLNRTGRGDPAFIRYATAFGGAASPFAPGLRELSPYPKVKGLKAQVLLVHGLDDGVIDYSQSLDLYRALRRSGVAARLIPLKGTDHWLYEGASRREVLEALTAFLGAALAPS